MNRPHFCKIHVNKILKKGANFHLKIKILKPISPKKKLSEVLCSYSMDNLWWKCFPEEEGETENCIWINRGQYCFTQFFL